jgi:hypothetical protein
MNLYLPAFSLGIREELEKASMLKKEAAGISGFNPAQYKTNQPKASAAVPAGAPSSNLPRPTGADLESLDAFKAFKARSQNPPPVAPRPPSNQELTRRDMYDRMNAGNGITPIDPRGAETLRSGLLSGALTPRQVQDAIRMMPAHERTQAQMIVAGGRNPQEVLTAANNYNSPYGGNAYGKDYLVHQNNQNWLNAQRAITQSNPLIGKAGTKENAQFLAEYRNRAGSNLHQNHEALQGALAAMNSARPAGANVAAAPGTPVQATQAPSPATTVRSSQGSMPVPVSSNDTTPKGAPLPGGPIGNAPMPPAATTSAGGQGTMPPPVPAPASAPSNSAMPKPAPIPNAPTGTTKTSMDLSSMPMNENILPNIGKQAKWKYVRTKDGLKLTDGNLVYSFGGFPENFSADDSRVSRMSDDSILDFEKDMLSKGTAQIHRSSPDNIYMTLADGSQNPTFMLQHEEGKNWRYSPSKKFLSKLKAISDLSKKENPSIPETVDVNPESMLDAATDAGVKLANLSLNMTADDLADASTNLIEGVKNFGKGFVHTHATKPVTGFLESYMLSKGIGSIRDYLNPKRKIERLIDPAVRKSREVWPLAEAALATLGSRAIAM